MNIKELKTKAEAGDAQAQYQLGSCYMYGDLINKDHVEALKWCRLAAAKGIVDANYLIGHSYKYGLGVKRDHKEAARWMKSYEKAKSSPA